MRKARVSGFHIAATLENPPSVVGARFQHTLRSAFNGGSLAT